MRGAVNALVQVATRLLQLKTAHEAVSNATPKTVRREAPGSEYNWGLGLGCM